MKKNLLKRIGAVALAVAVSLTMGTAAFAAEGTTGDDYTTVNVVKKTIDLSDETAGVSMYEPTITYSYAVSGSVTATELAYGITEGTDGALNKEYKAHVSANAVVKAGNSTGAPSVSIANIAFSASNDALEQGKDTKEGAITATAGTKAGIFRFKVTESQSPAKATVGITEPADYVNVRYLDVYVANGNSGLEVTNIILFKIVTEDSTTKLIKTEGWTSANDLDSYATQDLTVSKVVDGALGDKTFDFPFSVALSNITLTNNAVFSSKDGSNFTKATSTTIESYTLKDGESFKIYGVPKLATPVSYVATETNGTSDIYTTAAAANGTNVIVTPYSGTAGTRATVNAGATASAASTSFDASNEDTIAFTNTLDQISPTNVVMRFAPYLFILGAAIVLLVMMRRRMASRDTE